MNKGKNRTSMDVQNQIFLLYDRGYSLRNISRCLDVSRNTIRKFVREKKSQKTKGIVKEDLSTSYDEPQGAVINTEDTIVSDDKDLKLPKWLSVSDLVWIEKERHKGIAYKTLYCELKPPITYWTFWNCVRDLLGRKTPKISVRLTHQPGEKVQVDFTDGVTLVDPQTGEEKKTQLFVGVLPFSQLTFAIFKENQKLPSFIEAHEAMWRFFGGVTPYVVPDNLKSAVAKAHLYDPDRNKTFCHYANGAGFAVLPARPYHPRDKGAVEVACRILQDQFIQQVRHRKFYSLHDLNASLFQYLKQLNHAVMKDYGVSRWDRFQEEKQHLKPVPEKMFEFAEWKLCKVHPDCHIQVQKCLYSVPFAYVGKQVRVRVGPHLVEVFDSETQQSLTSHVRGKRIGERITKTEHWPPQKADLLSFDFAQAKREAQKIGPETSALVENLSKTPYPLQYLRMLQGFLRLLHKGEYSQEDAEYACKMSLATKRFRLMFLKQCCQQHKGLGNKPIPSVRAPKRDLSTLFLHSPYKKDNQ